MPFRFRPLALTMVTFLAGFGSAHAQTIGLITNPGGAWDGYTLFSPQANTGVYLIDNDGMLLHEWSSAPAGNLAYLQDNGDILMAVDASNPVFTVPGAHGIVRRLDWDSNVLWEFDYSDSTHCQHHDIEPLPNGNLLVLAFELKDQAECLAAGRNPALLPDGQLFPEHIIEVQPVGADSGAIVWEWHVWDHLVQDFDSTKANYGVVADHPELINLNYGPSGQDWNHANSIAYNADLDQIVMSVNAFNEWWIIDHSTTTAEAAGHTGGLRGKGGDVLYRWGNPEAYDRGTPADRHDYRQHNVHWIPDGLPGAGNILFFNNGNGRPVALPYSSAEEVITTADSLGNYPDPPTGQPHDPDTAAVILTSIPPDSLYSRNTSSAQRLPNGNTLMCEGTEGTFWELDPSGNLMWKYVNPVNGSGPMVQNTLPSGNAVFRTFRYPTDHPAFDGRDLTPQGVLELPPVAADLTVDEPLFVLRQAFPNPFSPYTTIPFAMRAAAPVRLEVFDVRGRRVATLVDEVLGAGEHRREWRLAGVPSGVYFYALSAAGRTESLKLVVAR